MATTYPGAEWDPLGPQTQPVMGRHDIVCLHTMAGTFTWTDEWFHENGFRGTESHFGLAGSGRLKQWQDLDFQADANYDGNHRCISIETADRAESFPDWSGSDVPPWTEAQLDVLVELVGWLCDRYDIPRELVPDSRPGRRGIAYHRQGIPGAFSPPYTGLVAGGELWTKLPNGNGKVCPGDNRIAQIHEVILPRLNGEAAGNPFPALDADEQRAALRLARKLEVRSRTTFPDISGDGRLAELVQGLQVLRGASGDGTGPSTAAAAATTDARTAGAGTEAWFTEVFRGAVLDGLRRPSAARPDRGALRGPMKNLFRQVLAEGQG